MNWKHISSKISRRLFIENLEDRRLLTVSPLSSLQPSANEKIAFGREYLLSNFYSADAGLMIEAPPEIETPLYFSSIRDVYPDRLEVAATSLPADDSDFAMQRARPFMLAPEILEPSSLKLDDTIVLDLFVDATYPAVLQSKSTNINGTTSLVVKLEEYDFAFGYISITGDDYLVSIDVPERRESYETRLHWESGTMFLVQFHPDRPDALGTMDPIIDVSSEPAGSRTRPKSDNQPPSVLNGPAGGSGSGQAQIDVMVVYTPAAQAWSSNIQNTVATAMSRSNVASTNSNLGMSFNLVYSGLVNYTEAGSSTDLGRLRGKTDGFMDEIHSIRDTHAADMVAILTFTQDTGGVAYLLNTRFGAEDLAFSLTRVQQASSTDTFIHELGHNMGAMHSKFQNIQSGPTNWGDWPENQWSAGWRWLGNNGQMYTSVMAYSGGQYYPDGINATRVSVFSDPSIFFQGQPTGHPVDGDNARTLRDVRSYIGQYRDADTLLYCSAAGAAGGLGITNTQLSSVNQNSSSNAYYDFSFQSQDIAIGELEQLVVSITNPSTLNQVRVWVDWNDDKDFFDAGELVHISSPTTSSQFVVPISPPPGTSPGEKRVRIRLHRPNSGGNLSPCGNSGSGEVQDFKLNVIPWAASIEGSFVYHADWTGSLGDATDPLKTLAKESGVEQTLTLDNLINSWQGINGLEFQIANLPGILSASDFVFQWSPQGAFSQAANPPSNWSNAPLPSSITVTSGSPAQVLIRWPNSLIANRWLRVTVLANENTGLGEPEVFYIGHLLGETTGPENGLFTVSFADITVIRNALGQTVNSGNIADIDKNGTVSFADINLMRESIGDQLTVLTIPAADGGGSGAAPLFADGQSDGVQKSSGRFGSRLQAAPLEQVRIESGVEQRISLDSPQIYYDNDKLRLDILPATSGDQMALSTSSPPFDWAVRLVRSDESRAPSLTSSRTASVRSNAGVLAERDREASVDTAVLVLTEQKILF